MEQPSEQHFKKSTVTPAATLPVKPAAKKLPEKDSADEATQYSREYAALLSQLQKKGTLTSQDYRDLFNAGTLEHLVKIKTGFNFNFDYTDLTSPLNDHYDLSDILFGILQIMKLFGIQNSTLFATKDKKSVRGIPFYKNFDIEFRDGILTEDHVVMAWFSFSLSWIIHIVHTFLMRLKGSMVLSKIGAQYEESKDSTSGAQIKKLQTNELFAELDTLVTDSIGIMKNYLNHRKPVLNEIDYTSRDEILAQLSDLFNKRGLEGCYQPHAISSMIPIEVKPEDYRIRGHWHVSSGVAVGLIFLAQQELTPLSAPADQTANKRPVFDKIRSLFASRDAAALEKVINAYRLEIKHSDFDEDKVEINPGQPYFFGELTTQLREILIKHRLRKLERYLVDETCRKDNPIWSDIEQLFLHYYDGSGGIEDCKYSYVYLDPNIQKRINDAAKKIRAIEQQTQKQLVTTQLRPSCFNTRGILRIIAFILVYCHSRFFNGNLDTPQAIIADNVDIFKGVTWANLLQVINYYLNGAEYYPHINIDNYLDLAMRQKIKSAVAYVIMTYKDENLVIKYPPEKVLTQNAQEVLRSYLLKDYQEESPAAVVAQANPAQSVSLSRSAGILHKTPHKANADNGPGIELEPIVGERTPIRETRNSAERAKNHNSSRHYGTSQPSETLTAKKTVVEEHSELSLRPKIRFPVNQHALAHCSFSRADVVTLLERILHIRVVFLDEAKYQGIAKQRELMEDARPVMHFSSLSNQSIRVYVDPFPRCSAYIAQRMIIYSQGMIRAHLSKQEISALFSPLYSSLSAFFKNIFSEDDKAYSQYARQIVEKYQQENSTVEQVISLIKTIMSKIEFTVESNKKYSSVHEDFLSRVNYIFYRTEGKSYAEVNELTKQNSVAQQEVRKGPELAIMSRGGA